tara:strand:- start:213 stop:785 length:573 start_codon:yes stop_codon:yes gene_type:complete
LLTTSLALFLSLHLSLSLSFLSHPPLVIHQIMYRMAKLRHPCATSSEQGTSIVPPREQPAAFPPFPSGWERVEQVAHSCLQVERSLRPDPSAVVDLISELLWNVPPRTELEARWVRLNELSAEIVATLRADGRLKLMASAQHEFVYAESTEEQLLVEFVARELEVTAALVAEGSTAKKATAQTKAEAAEE